MKHLKLLVIVIAVGAVFLFIVGCSGAGAGAGSTCTLSGSVATPAIAPIVPDGTYVYLKLVANGGSSGASAVYWTRAQFSGGTASYSISGIASGVYTGWVFIDMNDNAPNNSTAMPDTGDYGLQTGQQIDISSDRTQNVGPNGWNLV